MEETRAAKYGRNLAVLVNHTIKNLPVDLEQRAWYRESFMRELKRYSFKSKKRNQPKNEGCVYELEKIKECSIKNPIHFARLVKEGIHLMYQKGTAKRIFDSLVYHLE